jgi:hypothetical protein
VDSGRGHEQGIPDPRIKRLRFRVDALNVFNHPYPVLGTPSCRSANPTLTLGSTIQFGDLRRSRNRQFLAVPGVQGGEI